MSLLDISSIAVPGAYISEGTFGLIPQGIASHFDTYMLGHSTKLGAPKVPTFIQSLADFDNVFAPSLSRASVDLFFQQRPGNGLWFIPVTPRDTYSVSIATVTGGATYALTIDGFQVAVVAVAGETTQVLLGRLADRVNLLVPHLASLRSGVLSVKPGSITVTASANVTLGSKNNAPAYPTVRDCQDALATLDNQLPQGFLIAPEFFQSLDLLADHTALATVMEAHAQDHRFLWVAIADCMETTATLTTGGGAVNAALAERQAIGSPRGHLAYYFPYLLNLEGDLVPPSAVVAGVALRRYRVQGFRQPPAGASVPVYGTKGPSFPVSDQVQQQLNPKGVNCIRVLANKGTVVYGARTVSDSPYYTFVATRVIMNVLSRTLADALDELVFESVDGLGIVFARIKGTAAAVCERLRVAGALYGATPDDAYRVVCDASNNPGLDLDQGRVAVDVYVKPSPTLEVLVARVYRTSLAQTLNDEVSFTNREDQE